MAEAEEIKSKIGHLCWKLYNALPEPKPSYTAWYHRKDGFFDLIQRNGFEKKAPDGTVVGYVARADIDELPF